MNTVWRHLLASTLARQLSQSGKTPSPIIIAVNGAGDKAQIVNAIATILCSKYRVVIKTPHYGDDIDIPLACLGISSPVQPLLFWQLKTNSLPPQIVVAQIDQPAKSTYYPAPRINVIAAPSQEAAKQYMMPLADTTVSNYKIDTTHPRIFTYGIDKTNDYQIKVDNIDLVTGLTGTLLRDGHARIIGINLNLYDHHSAPAIAAAYAVADLLGLSLTEIESGLTQITPRAGHMDRLAGHNGTTIIDNGANTDPHMIIDAIRLLLDAPETNRKIGVIGSSSINKVSPEQASKLGQAVAKLDLLIIIGDISADSLSQTAAAAGLDENHIISIESPYAAGEYLRNILKPDDLVLVDGLNDQTLSGQIIQPLLAESAEATAL